MNNRHRKQQELNQLDPILEFSLLRLNDSYQADLVVFPISVNLSSFCKLKIGAGLLTRHSDQSVSRALNRCLVIK
jgi:hypothetical protein